MGAGGSVDPSGQARGRPRTVNVREVLNAIFYVLWTGCQWKALPKDLPPRSTVWEYHRRAGLGPGARLKAEIRL